MEHAWRVKLQRARVHLESFTTACADYLRASSVGFSYDRDPAVGSIKVRLHLDAEPPMELGAIAGDVLHNLRSALDSTAWAACHLAEIHPESERFIYFPITVTRAGWKKDAPQKLPGVSGPHLEVFRRLQPWYWDEILTQAGGKRPLSTAKRRPLARLNRLASTDRHRVPNLIVARASDTWLGSPDGVTVSAVRGRYRSAHPGDIVLEWKIEPPSAVHEVSPDGNTILAFGQDAADVGRSAQKDLSAMLEAVTTAVRRVEVDVLGVVSRTQLAELDELRNQVELAEDALDSIRRHPIIINAEYINSFERLRANALKARLRYETRFRDLFE